MSEKRNIIFIFPDQHRGNAVGFINPAVITPNLDKLASEGVVFERCQTNSPLCMPARASMMSGQYVGKHGCWNRHPFFLPMIDDMHAFLAKQIGR